MASGGHLGFVEFLDFDQYNTDTRVIPLIPLILGEKSVSGVQNMFGDHFDAKIQGGRQNNILDLWNS